MSAGALETQIAKDNLQALLIYAIAATVFTVCFANDSIIISNDANDNDVLFSNNTSLSLAWWYDDGIIFCFCLPLNLYFLFRWKHCIARILEQFISATISIEVIFFHYVIFFSF